MTMSQRATLFLMLTSLAPGCSGGSSAPEVVWGQHGVLDGRLIMPRAIAIDAKDRLYLVDWTARVQVFDRTGQYLGPTWKTPDFRNGRPSGLSVTPDGNLLVSDSHYFCLRVYSPQGQQIKTIGGKFGAAPGELGYVSDAVQDKDGYYYVGEFGASQRISKFDKQGRFVKCWGSAGSDPGQFDRIRALALGPDKNLYVADACNHRIQVFTRDGIFVRSFGRPGTKDGDFRYPYDLAFATGWTPYLYVVEYGNHRVQKFTLDGKSQGCWGGPGRKPGELASPWALAVDSYGRVHVVDSRNHRVQRIRF